MLNKTPDFTVEQAANDETTFWEISELGFLQHAEGGYAAMDYDRIAKALYTMLADGLIWLARGADGRPIGVLAMCEHAWWYGFLTDTYLESLMFYVRPEYRHSGAAVALMRSARDEAQKRGQIAFITRDNPDRPRKKTQVALEAEIAGFIPLGYKVRLR